METTHYYVIIAMLLLVKVCFWVYVFVRIHARWKNRQCIDRAPIVPNEVIVGGQVPVQLPHNGQLPVAPPAYVQEASTYAMRKENPMKTFWEMVLKDKKQWVNTNMCFIINNKHFKCSYISVLCLPASWSDFFIKCPYFTAWH